MHTHIHLKRQVEIKVNNIFKVPKMKQYYLGLDG